MCLTPSETANPQPDNFMAKNQIPNDPQGLMAQADHILNGNQLNTGQPFGLRVDC